MTDESRNNKGSTPEGGKVIPIRKNIGGTQILTNKAEIPFDAEKIKETLYIDNKPLHAVSHWPVSSIDFGDTSKNRERYGPLPFERFARVQLELQSCLRSWLRYLRRKINRDKTRSRKR